MTNVDSVFLGNSSLGQAIDIQQIDRSGQVAVLGVPNSGKSSLVNELVGMKAGELVGSTTSFLGI